MSKLTHISEKGDARMVDVSAKETSVRTAVAEGRIKMKPETLKAIAQGSGPKGDVLSVARIAGIMAGKRTSELIPLCHPLPLDFIGIEFELDDKKNTVTALGEARTSGKTGVEMEALAAVSVALLTIYDMAKAIDRSMKIGDIHLVSKTGGTRGDYKIGGRKWSSSRG